MPHCEIFFSHCEVKKILPSTDFGKIRELVTFIWQVTILLSVFISGSLFHNHLIITISYVSSPEYLLRSGRSGNTHVNKTTPLLALQGLTVLRTQEMILQAKHSDPKRCQESQVVRMIAAVAGGPSGCNFPTARKLGFQPGTIRILQEPFPGT